MSQEESEHNEVDGMKKVAYLKERLVICNDEDTDGRARVTTDEERVAESKKIPSIILRIVY